MTITEYLKGFFDYVISGEDIVFTSFVLIYIALSVVLLVTYVRELVCK